VLRCQGHLTRPSVIRPLCSGPPRWLHRLAFHLSKLEDHTDRVFRALNEG
jgi:hypothetical protein